MSASAAAGSTSQAKAGLDVAALFNMIQNSPLTTKPADFTAARRFGYRTTAMQAIEGQNLAGVTALITGATSGIGIETALALAKAGAHVIITARDLTKAEGVVSDIVSTTGNKKVEVMKLDLTKLSNVHAFTAQFLAKKLPINILILNAGVFPIERELTADGFEMNFAVNYLANFVLINDLLPALKAGVTSDGQFSRVVGVSSIGNRRSPFRPNDYNFATDYNKWLAYGHSKTCLILLMKEFNRLHSSQGITANAIHPGGILTGLQVGITKEEMVKMMWIDEQGKPNPFMKSIQEGAATSVWTAIAPELKGIGGHYMEDCWFSAGLLPDNPLAGMGVHSTNMDDAKKLWDLSVQLTK